MSINFVENGRRPWIIVGWLTIFLVGIDLFIVSPFLPQIGHDLGREPSQLTLMVSLFSIAYAIACPLQGRIAERVGVSRMLLFGIFMMALANLLTALSNNLPALLISRLLAGIAAASISPMLYTLTAERSPLNQRATNLARINSGLVIALLLGAPLGLVLGDYSGWRLVFGLLALAFVAMFPVNRITWQELGHAHSLLVSNASPHESLRGVIPHLLCMALWGASVYAEYTMLGTAFDAEYRLAAEGVAAILASFGLGATVGGLQGGWLADRIGAVCMVRLCFIMMACTNVCLYLVYQSYLLWAVALNMFTLALVAYGFFPALQATAAQRFTIRRPTVMGLLSSSLYIGITIGATVGGLGYSIFGMLGVIAIALALALFGLGAAAFLNLPS